MSDTLNGIIVGAAAAAIGTIIAFKYINRQPVGGGQPNQVDTDSYNARGGRMSVVDIEPYSPSLAPFVQANSPITEAAYSVDPIDYEPAFGQVTNQPGSQGEAVLPI